MDTKLDAEQIRIGFLTDNCGYIADGRKSLNCDSIIHKFKGYEHKKK